MKVLLLNGSPHPNGCTFRALSEVEKTLQQEGGEKSKRNKCVFGREKQEMKRFETEDC